MIIDFQDILEAAAASETAAVSETTTIPEALVNTALGMGTVFVVLILISFIIYLFKYIPKLLEIGKKKPEAPAAAKPLSQDKAEEKAAPAASQTEDDSKLVAVIAAAVAAQMSEETGVPVAADGLVIRSIKKRTFSI